MRVQLSLYVNLDDSFVAFLAEGGPAPTAEDYRIQAAKIARTNLSSWRLHVIGAEPGNGTLVRAEDPDCPAKARLVMEALASWLAPA